MIVKSSRTFVISSSINVTLGLVTAEPRIPRQHGQCWVNSRKVTKDTDAASSDLMIITGVRHLALATLVTYTGNNEPGPSHDEECLHYPVLLVQGRERSPVRAPHLISNSVGTIGGPQP